MLSLYATPAIFRPRLSPRYISVYVTSQDTNRWRFCVGSAGLIFVKSTNLTSGTGMLVYRRTKRIAATSRSYRASSNRGNLITSRVGESLSGNRVKPIDTIEAHSQ